jgi:hypothetical protein
VRQKGGYPDPPPVILLPESIAAKAAYQLCYKNTEYYSWVNSGPKCVRCMQWLCCVLVVGKVWRIVPYVYKIYTLGRFQFHGLLRKDLLAFVFWGGNGGEYREGEVCISLIVTPGNISGRS